MLHLLKEKTKIAVAHKDRKKYEALMPVKRIKPSEEQPQSEPIPKPREQEEAKKSQVIKKIQPKMLQFGDTDMK